VAAPPRIPTPELAISPSAASTHTSPAPPESATKAGDEWISPAFIKRARTSYGSLFESNYDPFAEEDGTVPGKGRKRTRLSSTWRYSSRSPTPEAEEELVEPVAIPPEPVTESSPTMIDEGCQTISLEDGGAAEALANFARQATNVGRDSYIQLNGTTTQKALVQEDAPPRNTLSIMEPSPFTVPHTEMDGLQQSEFGQNAPRSPHLQPVPSEFLPQVSPLVSSSIDPFPENIESEIIENGQNMHDQPQLAHNHPPSLGREAEGLYGASPTGKRGDEAQLGVSGFHDPTTAVNGVQTSGFEDHYISEDQYGHWQSSTAQLGHHASPYREPEEVSEIAHADRFYVESEEQEQYTEHGFPTSHAEILHSHQYPEIDDGLPNQHSSGWVPSAADISYPHLQDHSLESGTTMHPLQPRSVAMSRSQSGQSQVVDLTESSDEEVEEQPAEGSAEEEGSILEEEEEEEEDENLEGSVGEDEEGSLDEEQEVRESEIQSRYFQRDDTLQEAFEGDREDQSDQGDYYYYDDDDMEENEADTHYERYNAGFDLGPGQHGQRVWDNEEEGSYEDEDEETEEPIVQRDLVVIDLLSSDDEDAGQPTPTISAPVPAHESEESDGDESVRRDESDAESKEEPSLGGESGSHSPPSIAQDLREESEEIQSLYHEHGDLVDGERAQHGDQHQESEALNEPAPTKVASHVETAIPGQFGRPTLFSPMFNLDGANDELQADVSYPTLPKDKPSPPVSQQQPISHISENVLSRTRNTQLPTPDATQSFGKAVSPELSFTSTTDGLPSQTELEHGLNANTTEVEMEQVEAIVEAPSSREVEADTQHRETTVVTIETSKTTIEDDDVGMSNDGNFETTEPELTNFEPLDGQTVDQEPNPEAITESKTMESEPVREPLIAESVILKIAEDSITVHSDPPTEIENLDVVAKEYVQDTAENDIDEPEELDVDIKEPALEATGDATVLDAKHLKESENLDLVAEEPVLEIAEDSIAVVSDPPKEKEILDKVAKEPEFTVDSPRRSHRRVKPTVTVTNTKENVRPVTPTKAGNAGKLLRKEQMSPRVVLDSRAPPKGHDASIELALASLESPSKQQHDLRKQPVADLKLRLSRALRTELSEFTALKVLRYHLNQKLDALAVATTTPAEPIRAKNGPRHYQITFNITDPSIAPSGVTEVQIFRPYKEALPTIKEGDGILLRNFQVMSVKSRGFGLRSVQDEGSSWAVFKDEGEAEVRGPPVEFGDGEKNHVIALKAWYETLDAVAIAKISRANGDKTGTDVEKSIAKAS